MAAFLTFVERRLDAFQRARPGLLEVVAVDEADDLGGGRRVTGEACRSSDRESVDPPPWQLGEVVELGRIVGLFATEVVPAVAPALGMDRRRHDGIAVVRLDHLDRG